MPVMAPVKIAVKPESQKRKGAFVASSGGVAMKGRTAPSKDALPFQVNQIRCVAW